MRKGQEKAPAEGDRIDIGGKLPQFDVFARFAYRELVYDNLAWIRVADPKAEKLDDIQYATLAEIHAYQLKWSNKETPSPFSFNDFKPLFLECVSGWQILKAVHASEHKKVIAHLLTNRPLSTQDSIKDSETKIGSFSDFVKDVWQRLKIQQDIDPKWKAIVDGLRIESKLSESDFLEFIKHFEFHPEFDHQALKIGNIAISKQEEDLLQLSRLFLEEAADKKKTIHYTDQELINALGPEWQARFRTTFNHELIVDKHNYQPITATLNELDQKLEDIDSGYLFLIGGPGTGKSTLLTDWAKNRKERVIRYYAFDFNNPSSLLNDHERGEAVNLFFDLVFQLKQAKVRIEDIQPYKKLPYLKTTFEKQLAALGTDYATQGTKTVIIIDGLDHIPREYTQASNSLLAHLPKPGSLPEGVYIVLGSQSYDLNDLRQEVKLEFEKQDRAIKIAPLARKEVFEYIESGQLAGLLSEEQKQTLFEKSQGHPLYLSYIVPEVIQSDDKGQTIESFDALVGDIDTYYHKIWGHISGNNSLIDLLGLIARINGSISPDFINEWGFSAQVLSDFRKKAKLLFDESQVGWSFFHNSFRQFLIYNTSLNPLTAKYDKEHDKNYHSRLADFYTKSSFEKVWNGTYHLYMAEKYDGFLKAANPNGFVEQFLSFRPADGIRRDIKLGIELAKKNKDIYLLVRYLFALSELEARLYNIDPVSFFQDFLDLGEVQVAKNYIRTGKTLHCSESFALYAARLFIENGDNVEGKIVFNLAEPEYITKNEIVINDDYRYEKTRDTLEEWVKTAPYFYNISDILTKIKNVKLQTVEPRGHRDNEAGLKLKLLVNLGESLIKTNKWDGLELLLQEFDLKQKTDTSNYFYLLHDAIEQSLVDSGATIANKLLALLLEKFPKDKTSPIARIHIADLIYHVTGDLELVREWIDNVPQPELPKWESLRHENSLDPFLPKIRLNTLMNMCGIGVPITEATPSAEPGSDEEMAVDYERMLCLIAKILSDGLTGEKSYVGDFKSQVTPIVTFFYKDISHRNPYWSNLTQTKSEFFDLLINAASTLGGKELTQLGDYLIDEFSKHQPYWPSSVQRDIIISLFEHGFDTNKVEKHLIDIESFMLNGQDIDGRINECSAHAKAWLSLSKNDIAKERIKWAIRESLGVGYRKDYQLSSWIEWLQIINNQDPKNAKERILWFLSHLRHVEQTTEGRAFIFAAEEILQATFQWNFSAGRQQLEWQVDNALINFQGALSVFITTFLERATSLDEIDKIYSFYINILLYISTESTQEVLKSFLVKGLQLGGTDFLQDYLPSLINLINIKSLEEKRYSLLSVIKDFSRNNGVDITSYMPEFKMPENPDSSGRDNSANTLVIKSGQKKLTQEEVITQVTDFNSLKALRESEDTANSYFKWDAVLEKVSSQLTIDQLKELSNPPYGGRKNSDFFANLSNYALKLGGKEVAVELAEKAVSCSNNYGWIKWYDGGTRITAFQALKNADPTLGTSKGFDFLAHDAVNYDDPGSVCQQLVQILPVVTEGYEASKIWKEVFSYLNRLMSTSTPLTDIPNLIPQKRPLLEDLVDLLIYLTKNPIDNIRQKAQALLASLTTLNDTYTQMKLREMCKNDEEDQETFIHVLMMMKAQGKNDVLVQFMKELSLLAISQNYLIRSYSNKILKILGQPLPSPTSRELPKIYDLIIEEKQKPDFGVEEDPLNPKFNLDDPEDLIIPYNNWIDILEGKTELKKINLLHRMTLIMKEIDDPKKWTTDFEKELIHHLREINLNYAYPRPRVKAAKRALMHLVTELIDSKVLDETDIRRLFETHDHKVYSFPEIKKPDFIQKLAEGDNMRSYLPPDWIDNIEDNGRLNEGLVEFKDGWYVLGEYTKNRSLDWGRPTETYMAQLVPKEINNSKYYIFGSAFEVLTEEYYDITIPGKSIIVIRSHLFDQFDLKSRWIAIHPVLARHLEWVPDNTQLFGWKDTKGNPMIQSIYWSNGNFDMSAPRLYSEAGDGWFVIASKKAMEEIKKVAPDLIIQKKAIREKFEDSGHIKNEIEKLIEL